MNDQQNNVSPDNDDIGEETRLRLYHSQLEIRQLENRAHDMFLQDLVQIGISHVVT